MDLKITAEWLQAMVGDDDYEPSGLMTPRDRAELERRKAERLAATAQDGDGADKASDTEKVAVANP
jgi:hypothetical protein